MFQSSTGQQARGVIRHGIEAAGTWLGCMGIFTGLLWLSSLMPATPTVEEPPAERAPQAPPPSPPPPEEKPEPFGTDATLDLPSLSPDPRCPSPSDIDTQEEVIPFGMGMSRPELLSSAPLIHTPEALAARVQGVIIAKCTLTCLGEVKDCRILKPLPHMDQAALSVLTSRRYKPVHYLGRAITVSYVFALRIHPPEAPPAPRPPRRKHALSPPPPSPRHF